MGTERRMATQQDQNKPVIVELTQVTELARRYGFAPLGASRKQWSLPAVHRLAPQVAEKLSPRGGVQPACGIRGHAIGWP